MQPVVKKAQGGPDAHPAAGVLEEKAFLAVVKTAEALQGRVAEMLKEHGLSSTQYNALRILRGAGPVGLTCSEIGERMLNRDPDITRLLNRMEQRGLIARRRERTDRRVIMTSISEVGLDLLGNLDAPVREFHSRTLAHLGPTGLHSMIRLLDAARQFPLG
jgi:DNA-binding MarR family transcriptional regulator